MASFVFLFAALVTALGGAPAHAGGTRISQRECLRIAVEMYDKLIDSLKPGSKIQLPDATYVIKMRIGAGGHGVVILAQEVGTPRWVAMKVAANEPGRISIRQESGKLDLMQQDPRSKDRFPEVYEVVDTAERMIMVFEWIPGVLNLSELLRKEKLTEKDAIAVIRDVAESVALVHEKGVVHRDIKSPNILKTVSRTRLIDFGLARTQEELQAEFEKDPEKIVGTADYMSPEIVTESRPANQQDDLWALGILFYEVLSGERPFGVGKDDIDTLREVSRYKAGYVKLKPIPGVSAKTWAIVEKMLHRDPTQRFQSAQEIVQALKQLESKGQ